MQPNGCLLLRLVTRVPSNLEIVEQAIGTPGGSCQLSWQPCCRGPHGCRAAAAAMARSMGAKLQHAARRVAPALQPGRMVASQESCDGWCGACAAAVVGGAAAAVRSDTVRPRVVVGLQAAATAGGVAHAVCRSSACMPGAVPACTCWSRAHPSPHLRVSACAHPHNTAWRHAGCREPPLRARRPV